MHLIATAHIKSIDIMHFLLFSFRNKFILNSRGHAFKNTENSPVSHTAAEMNNWLISKIPAAWIVSHR